MKTIYSLLIITFSIVSSNELSFSAVLMPDCSGMNQSQCNNDNTCNWVYDVSYGSCGSLTVAECYDYPGQCYVDSLPGWYDSSGPYCAGGTYQINNSYCEEILMPECSNMDQLQCLNEDSCEWVESIDTENCHDILDCTGGCTSQDCEAIEGCWWHFGTAYYDPSGCYGEHEADNSYCEEIVMPECSEMSETECSSDDSCDWAEDIDWGSCEDLDPIWNVIYYCDDLSTNSDNCYTYTCYGGGYGQWGTCCGGDPYIIADNSYCEDIPYELGDVNQDSAINIQDIIIIINLILNAEFDLVADINLDSTVNVLDVIQLVNIILN